MNRTTMYILLVALMALMIAGQMVSIVISLRLHADISSQRARASLPCAAIPTRLILDRPECADALLRAMNVTKVRIGPMAKSTVPTADS